MPTFQRRSTVCDAVRAIHAIEFPGSFELIVVVDGSSDGTAAALGAISGPVPTRIFEQNNAGAASAEILLFLDDDMICRPDILRQLAVAFRPETGPAPDAVSYQRYIVTPAENLQQCRDAVRADVLLAAKHPARAAEIFAQHGIARKKTRWLVRPLASVPCVAGLSGKIDLWLAAGFYGLHPALDRVLIRIFSLAWEINYWSAVK